MRIRFVSVTADDKAEPRGSRIQVELFQVVEEVNRNVLNFDNLAEREVRGPGFGIHVAAHGEDRSNGLQLIEDVRLADVSGVKDGV